MNNKVASTGVLKIIFGAIGLAIFGISSVVSFVSHFLIYGLLGSSASLGFAIASVVAFVASFTLMYSGIRRKKLIGRLSKYNAMFNNSNLLTFDDLTAKTGILKSRVIKDIKLADKMNLHFPIYIDKYQKTLIRGDYTFKQYLETEKQRELKAKEELESKSRLADPATSSMEAFRIESNNTINKLRAANLLLPGEEISNKLTKLETTAVRIFRHIERHPEKLSETRILMNYHIPTTLKLVEKYCQYDTMDFQPQKVKESKIEIERALDTVNVAFEQFLEDLFHTETLDVSTDIDVLSQMLERDGLTGSKFDINNTVNKGEYNE